MWSWMASPCPPGLSQRGSPFSPMEFLSVHQDLLPNYLLCQRVSFCAGWIQMQSSPRPWRQVSFHFQKSVKHLVCSLSISQEWQKPAAGSPASSAAKSETLPNLKSATNESASETKQCTLSQTPKQESSFTPRNNFSPVWPAYWKASISISILI